MIIKQRFGRLLGNNATFEIYLNGYKTTIFYMLAIAHHCHHFMHVLRVYSEFTLKLETYGHICLVLYFQKYMLKRKLMHTLQKIINTFFFLNLRVCSIHRNSCVLFNAKSYGLEVGRKVDYWYFFPWSYTMFRHVFCFSHTTLP